MTLYTASVSAGRLQGPDVSAAAAFGKAGGIAAADKREGDRKSPYGVYPVRRVFWRPDRLHPPGTALEARRITMLCGWCDEPSDPAYNRRVDLPYAASHEQMWRADGLYDLIVEIGHNDAPPVPGLGSAIFLHCALFDEDGALRPTLGCVAIPRDALIRLVERLTTEDTIEIAP